jgi:hypothetical protein
MIDQADERLEAWVLTALGKEKVEVSFAVPGSSSGTRAIGLFLLEVLPAPAPRTPQRPPLQVMLRYLVTVAAQDAANAHRILGELAFAAMDTAEFEVEVEPVPAAVWTALGVPLRPCFVLRVPLRRERPQPRHPRVRFPIVLRTTPVRALVGVVVGPGDIPIMGARVDVPSMGRSVQTDAQGRFRIPGVPAKPAPSSLRVRARGVETSVDLGRAAGMDEPLVIHMDALED